MVMKKINIPNSKGKTIKSNKKKVNFSIEKIEFLGNKDVKENINNALSSYKNKPNKEKKNIVSYYKLKKNNYCF